MLNRIARATQWGYELEADPRHAELLIRECSMAGTRGVSTPGIDENELEDMDKEVEDEYDATRFRAMAARANYLSLDRPDLAFAAKDVCRDMSNPTMSSWKRLKRIVR